MNDIWASTPDGYLYHHDGKTLKKLIGWYGDEIWGETSQSVWSASIDHIFHFNGVEWKLDTALFISKKYPNAFFNTMYGVSDSEIYLGGSTNGDSSNHGHSLLLRYDGKHWQRLAFQEDSFSIESIAGGENDIYIAGTFVTPTKQNIEKLYRLKNNEVFLISDNLRGTSLVRMIGNNIMISYGKKIFKVRNGGINLFKDLSGTDFRGGICGRSENDIFCGMIDLRLAHYNGIDFHYFDEISKPNFFRYGAVLLPEGVVFLMWDRATGNSLIVRGKLINK
ncbi:MAG: hypothetical protein LWX56_01900 [Ignavibacteria bacterium]|nr:hypothetical protein [Ignavibacteria bacterium]